MTDWQPIKNAVADGSRCALQFKDSLGEYKAMDAHFLHDDRHWYRIEPPMRIEVQPTHFLILAD